VSLDSLVERAEAGGYNEVTAVTLRGAFDPVADSVIDRLGACQRVEQVAVQLRLSQRDRALVNLVDGLGLTITEAARHIGVARETANRRLAHIHRCAQVLGPDNFALA
jgi:DNA-directed RNA polymerase specialized sigma24 family protein